MTTAPERPQLSVVAETPPARRLRILVVAVDPTVFPFGTRFYIPGYGYGIARDTGGAVIGNHIDIVEPDCVTAVNWGPRHLLVRFEKPRNKSSFRQSYGREQ